MARSAKTTTAAALAAPKVPKRRAAAPQVAPEPAPTTKIKPARALPATAAPEASARGKPPIAGAPTAAARVPPPSKGELRARIEKLELANATLKAKRREANHTAKLATRRIAELEGQVERLQADAAKAVAPVAPEADAITSRRGRPPGSKKAIKPGDAVSPGVAVPEAGPLDAEAEAARDASEKNA